MELEVFLVCVNAAMAKRLLFFFGANTLLMEL